MKKLIHAILALTIATLASQSAFAGKPETKKGAQFGALFYNGQTVGTVATPTSMPGRGVDTIFVVSNGQEGQLGVTTVAPGDKNYHGGRWAVYVVTWESDAPVPLFTSATAVWDALATGDLSMMRMPDADFVCPVHKNGPKS